MSEERRRSLIEEMGFVSFEDINNSYVEFMDDLDKAVWPVNERWPSRAAVLEWGESWKQRLLKRARHNLAQHLERNPGLKAKLREERDAEAADKNKKTWEERSKLGRQWSGGT